MAEIIQEKAQRKGRGRPSKFDRDQLIERVMHKFWEEGYSQVSLNEIAQEEGLTRASLYHSFGNKDALFLLALENYFKDTPDRILHNMPEGMRVGTALHLMFDEACSMRAADKKHRGCFFTNCINEVIATDLPVKKEIARLQINQKKLIGKLMKKAINNGELPENSDAKNLTNLLITFMHGFGTFSKTGPSEKDMKALCESFLSGMGFER